MISELQKSLCFSEYRATVADEQQHQHSFNGFDFYYYYYYIIIIIIIYSYTKYMQRKNRKTLKFYIILFTYLLNISR